MAEFSKTVRFDFPRIPVIGTLFLIILLVNHPQLWDFLCDDKGRVSVGVVTAAVIALGTAGICVTQLIALSMFDCLLRFKKLALEKESGPLTSFQWFAHIQGEAIPICRKVARKGDHDIEDRQGIQAISKRQVHATLHALEMECREKNPAFGVQLEYYYSLYTFFFTSALFAGTLLFFGWLPRSIWAKAPPTYAVMFLDVCLVVFGMLGTVRTRRMKEYLRVTLFNNNRQFVLNLLSQWFHCRFEQEDPVERFINNAITGYTAAPA